MCWCLPGGSAERGELNDKFRVEHGAPMLKFSLRLGVILFILSERGALMKKTGSGSNNTPGNGSLEISAE